MFIECLRWLSCLSCEESPEVVKVHGLSFKLLGITPELGQRVHFVEGTQFPCREDKHKKSDNSEDRVNWNTRTRLEEQLSGTRTSHRCTEAMPLV
ncbi:uncharacterized protein LOC144478331 [Augochlora pura]